MNIEELKASNLLLFDTICGSTAYGTNLPSSDTDFKGVFVMPEKQFFSLGNIEQINDESNDQVYYELQRFVELLSLNNPNMLELLAMPEDCIQYKHPLYDLFEPSIFLSKLCEKTFAGYAMTQVRKARGLNKKIMNPMPKERKSILDFCYMVHEQGSLPLLDWLALKNWKQEQCGLVNIPHMRDTYALFYDEENTHNYSGVVKKKHSNAVALSSVPKEEKPVGILSFNKDGYTVYCKDYKAYWDWVEKRNDVRYENTIEHGKNYDAKNMLHTFRLLDMAAEIAQFGEIRVRRPNRAFLLEIRAGKFEYDDLVQQAEAKIEEIERLYERADLPERPDLNRINNLLFELRKAWYAQTT